MTHSPEPWTVGESTCIGGGSNYIFILDASEEAVITTEEGIRAPHMKDADAARIVACVNACKGIPTEDLEKYGVVSLGEMLRS